MSNVRSLQLYFGYAESSGNWCLPVSRNDDGYTTPEEAMKAFLKDCREVFLVREAENHEGVTQGCPNPKCKARKMLVGTPFCSRCGTKTTQVGISVTKEMLADFIQELGGTVDDVGGTVWEEMDARGWVLGQVREGRVLEVYAMDKFVCGDFYSNSTMNVFTLSESQRIEPFPIEWVESVIAESVESP